MARIHNLNMLNDEKIIVLNIARNRNESICITTDEARECLRLFIKEELNYFSEAVSKQRKIELEEDLNFKFKQFENSMARHIDEKINKITEKIIEMSLSRLIEEEVNKRVEIKLNKNI